MEALRGHLGSDEKKELNHKEASIYSCLHTQENILSSETEKSRDRVSFRLGKVGQTQQR